MLQRCLVTIVLTALAASVAFAQESGSASAQLKPVAQGEPSLEETMRFIQKELNEQGKVSTIKTARDTLKNEHLAPLKIVKEVSVVLADPATCTLMWREVSDLTDVGVWENKEEVSLHDVSKLEVLPLRDVYNKNSVKIGHPELVSDTDPAVYVLAILMPEGKRILGHEHMVPVANPPSDRDTSLPEAHLFFRDEELASRVAKAMVHAVELCGGGSQPEPF